MYNFVRIKKFCNFISVNSVNEIVFTCTESGGKMQNEPGASDL